MGSVAGGVPGPPVSATTLSPSQVVSKTRSRPRVRGLTRWRGCCCGALSREVSTLFLAITARLLCSRKVRTAPRPSLVDCTTKKAVVRPRLRSRTARTARVRRVTREERILSRNILKFVSYAPDRGDQARVAAGGADFLAHVLHVDIDRAAEALEVVAPDLVQKLFAAEHLTRRASQGQQQVEFLGTQFHGLAAGQHLAAGRVDGERREAQDAFLLLGRRRPPGPALQRLDPGDQFLGLEGLGQIIVGADLKAHHLIHDI